MIDPSADLSARIAEIKHEYLVRLKDEWLSGLEAFRAIPLAAWNEEILEKLLFHAHSVTGSGATFGYEQLSRQARDLEDFARTLAGQSAQTTEQDLAAIVSLIDRLSATCHAALKDLSPA